MLQIPEVAEPFDSGDAVTVHVQRVQVRAQGDLQQAEKERHPPSAGQLHSRTALPYPAPPRPRRPKGPAPRAGCGEAPAPPAPPARCSPLNALIHEAELAGDGAIPRHVAVPLPTQTAATLLTSNFPRLPTPTHPALRLEHDTLTTTLPQSSASPPFFPPSAAGTAHAQRGRGPPHRLPLRRMRIVAEGAAAGLWRGCHGGRSLAAAYGAAHGAGLVRPPGSAQPGGWVCKPGWLCRLLREVSGGFDFF